MNRRLGRWQSHGRLNLWGGPPGRAARLLQAARLLMSGRSGNVWHLWKDLERPVAGLPDRWRGHGVRFPYLWN
jgi:hypothetical protein